MGSQSTGPSSFGSLTSGRPFGGEPPATPATPFEHTTTHAGGSGSNGCATVLMGVLMVSFVVCGGIVYYGFVYLPEQYRANTYAVIDTSHLNEGDKLAARQQIDRVVGEYKAGRISVSRTLMILQGLRESAIFPLATIVHAEQRYVKPSLLTNDEKTAAKLALQRLAYGVFEQFIIDEELAPLLEYIVTDPHGERVVFKDLIAEDELRLFLTVCKLTADDAQVPDEPFEVNFGAAFKRIVDEALAPNE